MISLQSNSDGLSKAIDLETWIPIKRVYDPATCQKLYFGWTKLRPEVLNMAVANVIKMGAAYFISRDVTQL